MQIDTAMVGVLVSIIVSLLAFAAWVGALHQKVRNNRDDIDEDKKEKKETIVQIRAEFKSYQIENKNDHAQIFNKLDTILQNGKK